VKVAGGVRETLRAILLHRHGRIIARMPQRFLRSTRCLGQHGMNGKVDNPCCDG